MRSWDLEAGKVKYNFMAFWMGNLFGNSVYHSLLCYFFHCFYL